MSEYVYKCLVLNCPYEELLTIVRPLLVNNPSLSGNIFECFFLARLMNKVSAESGVTLYKEVNQPEIWSVPSYQQIEPLTMACLPPDKQWLIPLQWNQSVYDLLQFNLEDQMLRIVQIATAQQHRYRFDVIRELLEKFKTLGVDVQFINLWLFSRPINLLCTSLGQTTLKATHNPVRIIVQSVSG